MKRNNVLSTRNLVLMGMLSAVAAILMLFKVPMPFAPGFYKVDISEVPVLIGAFAIGPLAGVIIELMKNLLNILMEGTTTAYVGEIANFLSGVCLVFPAAIIYHKLKTKKGATIGLVIGTIIMSIASCFINRYITLPAYIEFSSGLTMDGIISTGAALNFLVKDLMSFLVFAVLPFNIVKCSIASLLTLLLYKQVSPFIKGYHKDA